MGHGGDVMGAGAYQNSQALWNPNLSVHRPIMPQSGMRIVTTFVTINYSTASQRQHRR